MTAADAQFGPLLLEHASAAPRPSFADLPDHGPGIAAADQARLFRRFSRAAERTTGTGLGLYFVRTVAEKHGGTVAVASEAGTFSRFTLRLPLSGLSSPAGAAAAQ